MAFTPRDVIIQKDAYPFKILVKNFNGTITRTSIADYSKATNYRNTASGGFVQFGGAGTFTFVPKATMPSTQDVTTTPVAILDDPTAEMAGITGHGPRPEPFTRVKLFFGTADATTGVAESPTPYFCWEDEYAGMSDVDPNDELDIEE